jgi:hypothetical protein
MTKFRTVSVKYPSICRRCGDEIPIGEKVRWAKGRGIYHFASVCPASVREEFLTAEDGVVYER